MWYQYITVHCLVLSQSTCVTDKRTDTIPGTTPMTALAQLRRAVKTHTDATSLMFKPVVPQSSCMKPLEID